MNFRQYFSIKKNLSAAFIRKHDRLAPLDGLRAISLLIIIYYHAYYGVSTLLNVQQFSDFASSLPYFLLWVEHADKAVDIFFVLSGFLIGNMLLKEVGRSGTIDFMMFYNKRAMRLFPAALLLIAIAALIPSPADKIYLWANVFYVQNFLATENMHVGWTWTLAVEEQFYIVMPLILLAVIRNKKALTYLVVLWILSFFIRLGILLQHPDFYQGPFSELIFPSKPNYNSSYFSALNDNLYTRYGALITGVIGSVLYIYHRNILERIFVHNTILASCLVWGAIFLGIAIHYVPTGMPGQGDSSATIKLIYHTVHHNLFSIMILVVMLATLLGNQHMLTINLVRNFLSLKIWYPLAQLAYPMYLFHIPVLLFTATYYGAMHPDLAQTVNVADLLIITIEATAIVFIFGLIVFLLIEKPFMNMRTLLDKK